jgi:AbrB family looped-hinge helix DNA binding protein
MTTEVVVKRKGQITIPVKLRRKFGIEENSKLQIAEQDDMIILRKSPSIFDLAGSGAGKGKVEEIKRMLDQMRAEE